MLAPEEVRVIFGNLEELCEHHEVMSSSSTALLCLCMIQLLNHVQEILSEMCAGEGDSPDECIAIVVRFVLTQRLSVSPHYHLTYH